MDFFCADTHFNHANIIKYCNRPFKDAEEMDSVLIENINSVVKSNDTLWFLGDFCFGSREPRAFLRKATHYRELIKCKNMILVWGNHDPKVYSRRKDDKWLVQGFRELFIEDYTQVETIIGGKSFTFSHYAMRVWNKMHHGSMHLYGHSHNSLPDDPNSLSFDCGVDCHNFKPISYDEVLVIMSKKKFKPIDHHGA